MRNRPYARNRDLLRVCIPELTVVVSLELRCGSRIELSEVVEDKLRVEAKFTLTLLPQPQIPHQAVGGHRTSSLERSVPLRIRRTRDSLD